jgi:uncharacterized protein YPO0396
MCDPVTAIAVTAATMKIGGALIENKAQNDQAAANKTSALDALKIQDNELSLRQVQERIAGKQQIEQGNAQVLSATGDVQSSAAARGVSGMTTDLLLGDVQAQGARYNDSVNQNTEATVSQLDRQKDAAYAEAQSRINSVPKANPWATAIKIGGAVVDYGSSRINMSPKGIK